MVENARMRDIETGGSMAQKINEYSKSIEFLLENAGPVIQYRL